MVAKVKENQEIVNKTKQQPRSNRSVQGNGHEEA